jgi:hypothetical protein
MKAKKGFLAVRVALVLSATAVFIFWATGQHTEKQDRQMSGPEELRRELWLAQAQALPQALPQTLPGDGAPVFVDAGVFVYTGTDEGALALADGLVPVGDGEGGLVWPVMLFEDALTRETVFLNAEGLEAGRLAPPPGYDPAWALGAAFPDGAPDGTDETRYDPACVALTAWLKDARENFSANDGDGDGGDGDGGGDGGDGGGPLGKLSAPASVSALAVDGGAVPVPGADAGKAVAGEGAAVAGEGLVPGSGPVAATNGTTSVAGLKSPPDGTGGVLVDAASGNDAWTGEAGNTAGAGPSLAGSGPKRSIQAGLQAAGAGGRLAVAGGAYAEDLDVRGRKASVRIQGDVVLSRRPAVAAAREASPAAAQSLSALAPPPAPTGAVFRASN